MMQFFNCLTTEVFKHLHVCTYVLVRCFEDVEGIVKVIFR